MTFVLWTQRCAILSFAALEPRVVKCDHAVQLNTCCICGCTVHKLLVLKFNVHLLSERCALPQTGDAPLPL